ncbi:MAG: DUF5752 family protein [Gammaproteobacteria bacterium]
MPNEKTHFILKDCTLIAIATGQRAMTLPELHNRLGTITPDSLYFHFWGGLLQPRFEEREYNNDFASWVRHELHDLTLAEQLAVIDPTDYPDLEYVRQKILEYIEERLEESEHLQWTRATQPFEFIRSQIVIFNTQKTIRRPEELTAVIPKLSPSSIFYHYIDSRRRSADKTNDFSAWINGFGENYLPLAQRLAEIDPYYQSLHELRTQMADVINAYFAGGV